MTTMSETREFPFNAEHFRLISDRIYEFSGIRLPEAKREMVYARLSRRQRIELLQRVVERDQID